MNNNIHVHTELRVDMQSFTRVLPPVRCVAVAGGTHGNEMSGVCLARHWLGSGRAEVQRPHIQVEPFLANTRAVERCVRYIDADLNRMFTDKNLRQPKTENPLYEVWRAQQINETYGPIGSESAYDMLLDMHNTTSNMGISLVLTSSSDHLSLHMAQFLQRKLHPIPCNAVLVEHPTLAYFHLRQVAKHGLSVEIGPQPQGVARADITEHMRRSIAYCLDFMHKFNSGMELPASKLDVHRIDGYIDYPRDDEGHITAIIHPAFQDRDWQPLHPGTPIFVSLSGEAIAFEGQEIVFPVFINEAAYYEKKIAFWITKRETLNVEPLRVEDGPHKECTSMVA